jgi:hypothetical protein
MCRIKYIVLITFILFLTSLISTSAQKKEQPVLRIIENNGHRALLVDGEPFENGPFKQLRIRNGDETDWGRPRFGTVPEVLRTSRINLKLNSLTLN